MNYITVTYALKWQIKNTPEYKFTADGVCFNIKRNKIVKRVVNGRSVGYCICGKFKTLKYLRTQLELIPKAIIPF